MREAQKYIVCVKDSEGSRTALHFACLRVKKRGGLVDVLHVLPPSDFQSLHLIADKMLEERRAEAEEMLMRMTDEAHAATGIVTSIHIREGNIGEEIAAVANLQQTSTSLVVAAERGSDTRNSLINWLQGALGEKFFIPLLLVPGKMTQAQMETLS